jgi:hypothetical protein
VWKFSSPISTGARFLLRKNKIIRALGIIFFSLLATYFSSSTAHAAPTTVTGTISNIPADAYVWATGEKKVGDNWVRIESAYDKEIQNTGIYTLNQQQQGLAIAVKNYYQEQLSKRHFLSITTEIMPAPTFYYAEDYHQQYLAKNPDGYCGLRGCFEAMASGTAIDAAGKAAGFVDGRAVFSAAAAGNPVATGILDAAVSSTATAIWTLAHTFLPQRFVLGGGLIDDHFELFAAPARAARAHGCDR